MVTRHIPYIITYFRYIDNGPFQSSGGTKLARRNIVSITRRDVARTAEGLLPPGAGLGGG